VGHNGSTTWMHAEDPRRVPFDDRAALEELERVRRAIEEWRERRKQVLATFDEFVRGFRTPAAEREIVIPPQNPPGDSLDSGVPENVHEPPASHVVDLLVQSSGPSADQRKGRARLVIVAGGVAVVIAAGVLLTRSRHDTPAELSGQRSAPVPPAAGQIPQSTVPVTPRPGPVEPTSGRTEIIALRRVWVRVIVDGRREVERELRADERVPLPSGRTIVIRTGDAGAIRLTMNGQDRGTLGPVGEVVTRTFTAPASTNR
jgi:hypothetical protein